MALLDHVDEQIIFAFADTAEQLVIAELAGCVEDSDYSRG